MSDQPTVHHRQTLLLEHVDAVHDRAGWLQTTFGDPPDVLLITGSAGPLSMKKHFSEGFKEEALPMEVRGPVVEGHLPRVVVGDCRGTRTAWFGGRVHLNEDPFDPYVTSLVVRAVSRWGCKKIIFTNAVGAVNERYAVGDVLVIDDHIDFFGGFGPLTGDPETISKLGDRFLDCEEIYNTDLQDLAREVFRRTKPFNRLRLDAVFGVMPGPHFETPATVRALKILGADAAGMSLVHEALAGHQMGKPILALSMVTNVCIHRRRPRKDRSRLTHESNMKVVRAMDESFGRYIANILQAIAQGIESIERAPAVMTEEEGE